MGRCGGIESHLCVLCRALEISNGIYKQMAALYSSRICQTQIASKWVPEHISPVMNNAIWLLHTYLISIRTDCSGAKESSFVRSFVRSFYFSVFFVRMSLAAPVFYRSTCYYSRYLSGVFVSPIIPAFAFETLWNNRICFCYRMQYRNSWRPNFLNYRTLSLSYFAQCSLYLYYNSEFIRKTFRWEKLSFMKIFSDKLFNLMIWHRL